jgi:hypothetical protein
MGTFCKNPKCAGQTWFGEEFCKRCIVTLENAALETINNYGQPKTVGCGNCGQWFNWEDFGNHFPCESKGDD